MRCPFGGGRHLRRALEAASLVTDLGELASVSLGCGAAVPVDAPRELSGVHVLFPKAPFARGSRAPVTDVHLLAGRLERKNDCPRRPEAKPRVCTSPEIDNQGGALARTGDGRAWVSFLGATCTTASVTS